MLTINWDLLDLLDFYYHSVAVYFYYEDDKKVVSLGEVGFNFEFLQRIPTSVWDAFNFTFRSM